MLLPCRIFTLLPCQAEPPQPPKPPMPPWPKATYTPEVGVCAMPDMPTARSVPPLAQQLPSKSRAELPLSAEPKTSTVPPFRYTSPPRLFWLSPPASSPSPPAWTYQLPPLT